MMTAIRLLLVLSLSCVIGPTALAGEQSMSTVVEGSNRFALELYGALRGEPGNLFFSPSSISTALAMTYAGARGDTAEQMARTLHLGPDPEAIHKGFQELADMLRPKNAQSGYRLSVANRLWGQAGYHFLPDFLAITRNAYHAELASVDFIQDSEGSRNQINQWVEEQTQKRIKDLVPPGVLNTLTRLVLTNAIYFKGDWSKPFQKALTKEQDFQLGKGKTSRVPMMHKMDDLRLGVEEGFRVLEVPYGDREVSAVVVLPDAVDGLASVEAKLTSELLDRCLKTARRQKVQLFLPRFRMTSQFLLADKLSSLGMTLPFQADKADFSGISSQERMYISAVLHKAFVDVNEEGTEAAAATGVVVGVRAAIRPVEPVVFRVDHPFLFLIVNNRSGSILFMGRVVNPAE